MVILALDPSSTATGFAIFNNGELMTWGTKNRNNRPLHEYAADLAHRILNEEDEIGRIVYEVNDAPMPRARQASMRKCHEGVGRILQALGVEGEPAQANRQKKGERRLKMTLAYSLKGRISEHAVDSICLGDLFVRDRMKMVKGVWKEKRADEL